MADPIPRLPDWPDRLWRCLDARRRRPHAWGSNDCVLYVAAAIEAMTGVDLTDGYRIDYADEAGADAWLKRQDCGSVPDLVDRHLPRCASPARGDVVWIATPERSFLALALGGHRASAPAGPSARIVPAATWSIAWRVG